MAGRNFVIGCSTGLPVSEATNSSRDTAIASFENFLEQLEDNFGNDVPVTPEFTLTVELFAGRTFDEVFRDTKGKYHSIKINLLRNYIKNAEKRVYM